MTISIAKLNLNLAIKNYNCYNSFKNEVFSITQATIKSCAINMIIFNKHEHWAFFTKQQKRSKKY